ncbi:outer membrane beta-barrel protein [Vibrio hippocampi]|uniref:Outer membrane protein beta-barrel domain-containing protein n=1 Tax=Vibrio hippocampi TaxID=654686 RepID=A0ABM8ZMW8_9VIBR|nr:outer membrane beta-barrel protein [Vibrio hippocampi]CAH0529840.1 hypothetical protein VHP8226_03596 [Vibrio hippocampi]
MSVQLNTSIVMLVALILNFVIPSTSVANGRGEVFASAGLASLNSDNGSNTTWVTQLGYLHNLSPFISIEGGYTTQISGTSTFSDDNGNDIYVEYWGLFVGGKVQHHTRSFTLYGKAGASYIDMDEHFFDGNINTKDPKYHHKSVQPYAAIGVSFPSPLRKYVDLSAEVNYQKLDAGYSSTGVTMSATYRF